MIGRTMRGTGAFASILLNSAVYKYAKNRGVWYYRLLLSQQFSDVITNEEFKIARKEEIDSYKQKVLDSDSARFDIDATMEKVKGYPIKGTEHTINYKEESK